MEMRQINEIQTPVQFVQLPGNGSSEGVPLNQGEQQYLLPHFSMGLIGKPGSGKSTMVKQLLMNDKMYKGKFDLILLISPSGTKLGIPIPEKQMRERFDLAWIFKKIDQVNTEQCMKMFGETLENKAFSKMVGPSKPAMTSDRFGNMSVIQKSDILGKVKLIKDSHSRFSMDNPFTIRDTVDEGDSEAKERKQSEKLKSKAKADLYKQIEQLDIQTRNQTKFNLLIILDDVVGQIKKNEYDPRLAQLYLNRRHLIYNGVISLITISQKYSMIPSRIRSNMNWFIMYQLNPSDFKQVYEDVVIYDHKTWSAIIAKIFGTATITDNRASKDATYHEDVTEYIKSKKYENLGIWVEYNVYFSNFKRLQF